MSTSRNGARKGRGALSNRQQRFTEQQSCAVDDGWDNLAQPLSPLSTTLIVDNAKSILTRNDSPDVPLSQSINPYRGCEHGCIYCYARPTHAYYGFSPGLDFETQLSYKPHAAALLRQALSKPRYRCTPIALGNNTDAYQPIERRLRLTRALIEVLHDFHHPFSVVTKSALIERDIDLLAPMAAQNLVHILVSITTLDNKLARCMEPRAAAPQRRLQTIRTLRDAGIPVGVMFAPLIPGLNEHEMEAILTAAHDAGAMFTDYVLLRLPLEINELFTEWLVEHTPLQADKILNLLRNMHGGQLYQAQFGQRMRGSGVFAELLAQRFNLTKQRLGLDKIPQTLNCAAFCVPITATIQKADNPQMSLF